MLQLERFAVKKISYSVQKKLCRCRQRRMRVQLGATGGPEQPHGESREKEKRSRRIQHDFSSAVIRRRLDDDIHIRSSAGRGKLESDGSRLRARNHTLCFALLSSAQIKRRWEVSRT